MIKKQDIRVDLPTIGLRTVKYLKKYSLEGLAYSSNKTVILNKDQVIKYCEKQYLPFRSVNEDCDYCNRSFFRFWALI